MSDGEHDPRGPDLETLFHEALELRPDERAAHLRARCADRPELRDELLELLAAHDDAPTGLEAPAWGLGDRFDELFEHAGADALEAARPGSRLGHYEIQRRLGQGGMGAVYLALQRQPLRRLVALKLIKPGMDTREVVRRFASERQALARLSHPGIAAVHDAGVTEQGRPYFVMEYVPGRRITDWCDDHKLGLRERLELFVQVCRAAQHAHAQGIVHRDLKPGNVLVRDGDDHPLPKIIDFGVAKAMVGRRGASTLSTRQGQVLGTPGYMSPEQAGAVEAPVDARSDVYSLGALLHELLTGLLPFERKRLRGASLATRLRETPPAASQRVAGLGRRARRLAQRRGLAARQLVRALRGDLDAILARALAPQPDDRYASVAALGTDLNAWLAGRVVRAPRVPRALSPRRLAARPLTRAAAVALAAAGLGAWVWPGGAPTSPSLGSAPAFDAGTLVAAPPTPAGIAPAAACEHGVFDGLDAGQAARRLLVLNVDDEALLPGTALQLVGHGRWDGRELLHVRAARADDAAPLTGVLHGAVVARDHDGRAHLHAVDGALPPGAPGVLLGAGGLADAFVDVPAEGLRAGAALGPGHWPGHLRPAVAGDAVLGFAAEAHAPGLARVGVWVQPQALPEAPRVSSTVAVFEGLPAGAVPPTADARAEAGAPAWQRAQPVPLVADAAGAGASAVSGGVPVLGLGVVGAAAPLPEHAGYPSHELLEPDAPMPGLPQGDAGADDQSDTGKLPGPSSAATDMGVGKSKQTVDSTPPEQLPPRTLKHALVEQAWIDLEGDGLLDLAWHAPGAPPKLFVQVDPGRFEERSELGNFTAVWATDQRTLLDADGDHRVDVVGVDEHGALQLWEGLGDGSFVDTTASSGLAGLAVADVQVLDVDRDASPDLVITLPDDSLLVLRNTKGVFTRVLLAESAAPPWAPNPEHELGAPKPSGPGWSQSHGDQ